MSATRAPMGSRWGNLSDAIGSNGVAPVSGSSRRHPSCAGSATPGPMRDSAAREAAGRRRSRPDRRRLCRRRYSSAFLVEPVEAPPFLRRRDGCTKKGSPSTSSGRAGVLSGRAPAPAAKPPSDGLAAPPAGRFGACPAGIAAQCVPLAPNANARAVSDPGVLRDEKLVSPLILRSGSTCLPPRRMEPGSCPRTTAVACVSVKCGLGPAGAFVIGNGWASTRLRRACVNRATARLPPVGAALRAAPCCCRVMSG